MSEFTQHTLRRMTRDEYERSISNSFLVSADMARKKSCSSLLSTHLPSSL